MTTPLVLNWHIEYLCSELQEVAERVFKSEKKIYDLVINISPGSTKSTICSIMYPAWIWANMVSAGFIGASYSHTIQVDLSRKNRQIIKSEKYQRVFPYVKLSMDQDSKGHFVNTEGGERISCGTGAVTGRHGDFIMVDDPLNPTEALSEVQLKATNTWLNETLSNRKKDPEVTPTILIMQRLHQDDPTAVMLQTRKETGVRHICLPAELSDKVKPEHLAVNYVDGLMDPLRLGRKALVGYKAVLGEYGFAGQYGQFPIPLGGGMFKTDRITVDDPNSVKFVRKLRYWDKAGSVGKGCFTVGTLMGLDRDGHYWILDVVRGQWGAAEREAKIKQVAEMDGRDQEIWIEQEPGSGGLESADATVKNLAGWRVRKDSPKGDKALRADPFAVQVNGRNVSMKPGEWNVDFIAELSYFPYSKYKDQVDTCSGSFAQLSKKKIVVGTW